MMVEGIRGESERREVVEKVCVDVDAKAVEEATRDPSSPISDISCQTTVAKPVSLPGRTSGPTRRSTKGGWTEEEDEILARAVKQFKGKNWKKIAEFFPGRSDVQCLHRWQKVLDPELVKGAWTKEEDEHIIELVNKYGPKKWAIIARKMPGRIGKQCRERWHNHLNPVIKKGAWTKEEEVTLIHAHQMYGNKWAEIAKFLPGRADNSIKNHWNCSVKKRLDSYFSSGLLHQLPKIAALDLNSSPAEMECPKDCATPKVSMIIDQKPIPAVLVNASSAHLLHGNLRMLKEDSHCSKTVSQPISMERLTCPKEVSGSLKLLAGGYLGNSSPAGREETYLRLKENNCDNARDSATSFLRKEDYCHSRATDALIPATPLQGKPYSSGGNESYLQVQSREHNTKELFASPTVAGRHAQSSNVLTTMDTTANLNKHRTSGLQEDMLLDLDKVVNYHQTPCTPVLVDKVNLDHNCYDHIQLSDLQKNLTKAKFLESDNSMIGLGRPLCCSAPPKLSLATPLNLNDPEIILRNAAKSFRSMPSILRKRHRTHLEPSPTKTPHKDHPDLEESCGMCKPVAICDAFGLVYLRQCEIQTHDDGSLNNFQHVKKLSLSSSAPSKSETYDARRSVEKRLEFAFDREWNGAKTNHTTSTICTPLSVTFNNHVDISNNAQVQLDSMGSLGQNFCHLIPEAIATCD